MKKNLRYIIAFLLALMMLLSLCACAQTGTAGNSGELDLDYVGEDTDQPEEEKPWYSWFTEAFSFGKKDTAPTAPSKPDSVADFYAQGSGDAPQGNKGNKTDQTPSTTPEEDTANKPSNSGGKKDDNKKDDQKGEDSNTPTPTPEQKPESKKDTVTITIRCDTAVNNGMHLESKWAGIVPASGVILPVTTVEVKEGDTVFDVLAFVCEKYKIHMSYRGGTSSGCYVDGINNLYEFDGGRWSGWMYCVNDWYPNYGCGVYFVKPGEVIVVVGPSGCGKSTYLKSLNRMNDLVPDCKITGQFLLDGEDIYADGVDTNVLRRRIGMVFQKPNPFPMSIYDNIAYGPRVHGIKSKAKLDRIVEESLIGAAVFDEVKDRLHKSALSLSGGQQQRICIARAIAVQPEVILMDEPTSALDPVSTLKIEELMNTLKEKYTVAIVTHNMQQATRISDYTAFFLVGEMVEYAPTDELFSRPVDKRTEDYITGRFG